MINELEQLQNFQDDVGSRDALDRLRALQHMQGRNQGLMGLPVVQEPVGDPRAMLQPPVDPRAMIQNIPQEIQQPTPTIRVPISAGGTLELDPNTIETMEGQQGSPFNPILGAAYGGPIRYREGGGPLANTAEGLASFGRGGDDILVHMNPEELQGLASMGNITYNPITGLPEAFSLGRFFSNITKPIRKITKSKIFKTLAPLALMIGAPYLASWAMPSVFGSAATAFGGALSTSGALGMGLATGLGGFAGNLLAGAKPGDALRQGLMSGVMAGGLHGAMGGPWMGTEAQAAAKAASAKAATESVGSQLVKQGTSSAARQAPVQSMAGKGFGRFSPDIAKSAGIPGLEGAGFEGAGFGRLSPVSGPTPIQQGTTLYPGGEATKMGYDLSKFTPDPTLVPTKEIIPGQAISTPTPEAFSMEGLKQIPKDIWKDYGNLKGAAKVVGMDLMQPDWEQTYAAERAAKEQLEGMGYVFTGFGTQQVITDPTGVVLPSNLSIQDILNRALYGGSYQLVPNVTYAPAVGKEGGGIGSLIHRQGGDQIGRLPEGVDETILNMPNVQDELREDHVLLDDAAFEAKHNMTKAEATQLLLDSGWTLGALNDSVVGTMLNMQNANIPAEEVPAPAPTTTGYGLGRSPYTGYGTRAQGGSVNLARGGEFRGQVPGQGHGMEDNVFMPIKDRGKQVGTLAVSPSEYVVDSYTMSALGNGNPDAGAKVMDGVVESVRKKAYGTVRQPNEIDGLQALRPMMERV
jgi:hypothetical protein